MMTKILITALPLVSFYLIFFTFGQQETELDRFVRDPFVAPNETLNNSSDFPNELPFDLQINGIAMDKASKFVIINNEIIKEKETFHDIFIDEINKDYLVVIYLGKRLNIPLKNK